VGRLNGAERLIDMVCSTLDMALDETVVRSFKRRAFLAILDEEEASLQADRGWSPPCAPKFWSEWAARRSGHCRPSKSPTKH
jgi:hypothetical protein